MQTLQADLLKAGLDQALNAYADWQGSWPAFEPDEVYQIDPGHFEAVFQDYTDRLCGNYPFFHPLYAGQMMKPPHPAAVIAYLAAMLHNPNNHALDGGPPTGRMEVEAVEAIAQSLGFPEHLGHLTSSGTIANLEALWVARQLHPDKAIAFSDQAHYTHGRMCEVIQAKGLTVPSLPDGRMDLNALEWLLQAEKIGTVVATLGTTPLGALDPLHELLALQTRYGFRIHVDAAYGGYYHLLKADPAFREFQAVPRVDSFVVDPHKHGLQPYGCGCVIFADPKMAELYTHESPYTYFTSQERHLGEISLECSRAGAAAGALWLTLQVFPLAADQGMGRILHKTRQAALAMAEALHASERFTLYLDPAMDIVTYFPKATDTRAISAAAEKIFTCAMAAKKPVYTAKLNVAAEKFARLHPDIAVNSETVTILRSCLLKPEHLGWVPQIMETLENAAG